MTVALVTDSTASLPPEVAAECRVSVVPVQVVIDDVAYDEGAEEASPACVAAALREKRSVSTSRPAPAVFADIYRRLADEGASEILSIHLSSEVSGTFESAQVAARHAPVPVTCVDTRQVGFGTGYAVETAAAVLATGGSRADAARAARERAAAVTSVFYVDTLEYLRRGGRIGGAAAVLGGALAVKPLLGIENGVITTLEKVRTSGRAISRLEELAVLAAGDQQVDVTVAHLASEERAGVLTTNLTDRLEKQLDGRAVRCGELGAVLGAHVGPGMLAICVAPLDPGL
ncbi:DegV family protein [Nocardioides bizhenqiangii]|uniref:DegV family protein n=1 Tax=Nocardioides bizhenqiangii TaxID=3095076 RepID=A0ABZ0ZYA0_9ACTN|nr:MULTISPECIES: DegV family protein [unclassified Nocardioides]MDZ5623206.1 DegV family protein [Nocardioides sp. HM23]WQQ28178.1 DegV family protein [Nocardioides sp. HM61]